MSLRLGLWGRGGLWWVNLSVYPLGIGTRLAAATDAQFGVEFLAAADLAFILIHKNVAPWPGHRLYQT